MEGGCAILQSACFLVLAALAAGLSDPIFGGENSSLQENDETHKSNDTSKTIEEGREDTEFEQLFNMTTNFRAADSFSKISLNKRKMEEESMRNNRKKNKVPSIITKDRGWKKVGTSFIKIIKSSLKDQNELDDEPILVINESITIKNFDKTKIHIIELNSTLFDPQKSNMKKEHTLGNWKTLNKTLKKNKKDADGNNDVDYTDLSESKSFKIDSMYELEKQRLITKKLLSDKLGHFEDIKLGPNNNCQPCRRQWKCNDNYYGGSTGEQNTNGFLALENQNQRTNKEYNGQYKIYSNYESNNINVPPVVIFPNNYGDRPFGYEDNTDVIKVKLNLEFELPQKKEDNSDSARTKYSLNSFRPAELNSREPFYRQINYPRTRNQPRNMTANLAYILYFPVINEKIKTNDGTTEKNQGKNNSYKYCDNAMESNNTAHHQHLRIDGWRKNTKKQLKFRNVFSRLILGKKNKSVPNRHKKKRLEKSALVMLNLGTIQTHNDFKQDDIYKILPKEYYHDITIRNPQAKTNRSVPEMQNLTIKDNAIIIKKNQTEQSEITKFKPSLDVKLKSIINDTLQSQSELNQYSNLNNSYLPNTKMNTSSNLDERMVYSSSNALDNKVNITDSYYNNVITNRNDTLNQIFKRRKRFIYQNQVDDIIHKYYKDAGENEVGEKPKIEWMQSMIKYTGIYATGTLTYCHDFSCYSVRCERKRCAQVDCMMYTSKLKPNEFDDSKSARDDSINFATPEDHKMNQTITKKPVRDKVIKSHCSILDYAERKPVPENSLPSSYIFDFVHNMQTFLSDGLYGKMTVCRQGRCLTIDSTNSVNLASFCNVLNVDAEGHCYPTQTME